MYLRLKEHCQHSDYIAVLDYLHTLEKLLKEKNKVVRLDIEAKAKNAAIFQLQQQLIV